MKDELLTVMITMHLSCTRSDTQWWIHYHEEEIMAVNIRDQGKNSNDYRSASSKL